MVEISDKFFIGKDGHGTYADMRSSYNPTFKNKNIEELLSILAKKDVTFDLDNALTKFSYKNQDVENKSEIPYKTSVLGVDILGYEFKGSTWNMTLKQIHEKSGGDGRLGGTFYMKSGIEVILSYKGEDLKAFKEVREEIKLFYDDLTAKVNRIGMRKKLAPRPGSIEHLKRKK